MSTSLLLIVRNCLVQCVFDALFWHKHWSSLPKTIAKTIQPKNQKKKQNKPNKKNRILFVLKTFRMVTNKTIVSLSRNYTVCRMSHRKCVWTLWNSVALTHIEWYDGQMQKTIPKNFRTNHCNWGDERDYNAIRYDMICELLCFALLVMTMVYNFKRSI